jgi:hypothetical protein
MTEQQDITTDTTLSGAVGNAGGLSTTPESGTTGEHADGTQEANANEPTKASREARYRTERNGARAERDALAGRVEQMQTRELERIAGNAISTPADLLALTGKTVADFLDESGELDTELVAEAAEELLSSRPGLRKNAPAFDPSQGVGGKTAAKREPSWGALLKD